jgi:hypothetical protein
MGLQFFLDSLIRLIAAAEVAELADAHGSGPCARKGVGVRVPSSAPGFSVCLFSSLFFPTKVSV